MKRAKLARLISVPACSLKRLVGTLHACAELRPSSCGRLGAASELRPLNCLPRAGTKGRHSRRIPMKVGRSFMVAARLALEIAPPCR